jgi:hypothetical protein
VVAEVITEEVVVAAVAGVVVITGIKFNLYEMP